jgi:hypothetical protein
VTALWLQRPSWVAPHCRPVDMLPFHRSNSSGEHLVVNDHVRNNLVEMKTDRSFYDPASLACSHRKATSRNAIQACATYQDPGLVQEHAAGFAASCRMTPRALDIFWNYNAQ